MKPTSQIKEIENFLASQIVDESQSQIPLGYELVKKYPLDPPFSYANILYNVEKSSYLYFVDELKLNHEEKAMFEKLYRLIEESLESPSQSKSDQSFEDHLNTVLKENERLFSNHSSTSMEKVKYYLKRDVLGFGYIDPLMHDVSIEDIS